METTLEMRGVVTRGGREKIQGGNFADFLMIQNFIDLWRKLQRKGIIFHLSYKKSLEMKHLHCGENFQPLPLDFFYLAPRKVWGKFRRGGGVLWPPLVVIPYREKANTHEKQTIPKGEKCVDKELLKYTVPSPAMSNQNIGLNKICLLHVIIS